MKKIILFLIGFFLILTLCAQTSTHRISKDSSRLDVTINSNVELRTEKTKADIQYKENVVEQLQTFNNTTIALSEALSKLVLEKPPNITFLVSTAEIEKVYYKNWFIILISVLIVYILLVVKDITSTRINSLSLAIEIFKGTIIFILIYLFLTFLFNMDYIRILSLLKLFG